MFFRLNTLKRTGKAPTMDLLRLTNVRGTKTVFLTPTRYAKHPRAFYMGVPTPLRDATIGEAEVKSWQ